MRGMRSEDLKYFDKFSHKNKRKVGREGGHVLGSHKSTTTVASFRC